MSTGTALSVAAPAMLAGVAVGRGFPRLWLSLTLVGAAAGVTASLSAVGARQSWIWSSGMRLAGEPLQVRVDGISALFLILLCVVGAAGALYSGSYWSDRVHPRSAGVGRVWWSLLLFSQGFVLLSANGLHFLIGWELFTVSAYFLITLGRNDSETRAAGWLYLAVSHVAVLALVAFFTQLAARTGTWDLRPMTGQAGLAPLFWLALVGFGIKAGVFPMHVWLPSAHSSAPSHVSAILSGVSIKLGVYGLVRFSSWLPVPDAAPSVVLILGLASAVLGVAFALGQHDLKRLLAYHSVENVGIILTGLGFALVATRQGEAAWGRLALAGGLLHVWNHGLFKALLFLGAGSVLHATGTRVMSRLGGLWRTMPWTTGLFCLGSVAICGLPPLNGFVSEWLIYLGLFDAAMSRATTAWASIPAVMLLGLTGALALACFVKVCAVVFLGTPRTQQAALGHESGWGMRAPMLGLAAACVAIGIAPILFWPVVAMAIGDWRGVWAAPGIDAPLLTLGRVHLALIMAASVGAWWLVRRSRIALKRSVTWDCGFAAPTPRMQYTAGSFAASITRWFGFLLRPQRLATLPAGPFPDAAVLHEHTPDSVLRFIVYPLSAAVQRIATAARSLQHGGVQSYILYLVIAIVGLGVIILAETGR
jgi:hydrogenase-4 component B